MQPEPVGFIQHILFSSVRCFFLAKSINVKTLQNSLRVLNPRLRASCKNCSFVVVVVILLCCFWFMLQRYCVKSKKKIYLLLFL